MKNKRLTYLLITVVAIVWGLIGYRVFAAIGDDGDTIVPAQPLITKSAPLIVDDQSPDTVKLVLNYRDPFEEASEPEPAKIAVPRVDTDTKPRTVVNKPQMNWNFIQYTGYIKNPNTKRLIALITINGKSAMFNQGDESDGVRLLKNLRDSIQIEYQHKRKFIQLN